MPQYTVINKETGKTEREIEAKSSKQALFLMAYEKTKDIENEKARELSRIMNYKAMEKAYEVLLLNNPDQMELLF